MEVTPPHKILYVITKANWGGAQKYVFNLATAASASGYEVLVASGVEGEMTERLRAEGITVAPLRAMQRDISLTAEVRAFFELRRIIQEFHPDIVHGNSSKAGGLGGLAARLTGVRRIIFTAHGWAFNEKRPSWQKALIWLFHYITVLLAHTTICVSEAMLREAHMPFVRGRMRVIHNGVDSFVPFGKEQARAKLAPAITLPFWIGTIAELHPTKQLDVLIRAFASVKDSLPNAALVIMGEGQERTRLEKLIVSLAIGDRAFLLGHVSQAPLYLKALDLFVLPSRSESFGTVLVEAGIAETSVIATNVGGIPEIVEDGVSGVLVPSGNEHALANAISALAHDTAKRSEFAHALHERAFKDFSKQQMLDKTFALYKA